MNKNKKQLYDNLVNELGSSQVDLLNQLLKTNYSQKLQSEISDKILDFSDNFGELPRGDKQGVAEALAFSILELIKNYED